MKNIFLLFILFNVISCSSGLDLHNLNDKIPNGEYCAKVIIEQQKSTKTYRLTITTKDNHLQKIDWSNGGWLDGSHYKLPEFYDNEATFVDDRGRKFTVKIIQKSSCK